jgi:hypothetical protein
VAALEQQQTQDMNSNNNNNEGEGEEEDREILSNVLGCRSFECIPPSLDQLTTFDALESVKTTDGTELNLVYYWITQHCSCLSKKK